VNLDRTISENTMNLNIAKIALAVMVVAGTAACAPMQLSGEPVENVSPYRHGNLANAQELVRGAYDKLSDAQYANNDQLGGHAARAKELLREAGEEIKLAAIAANER
jgi:hypothetical protein